VPKLQAVLKQNPKLADVGTDVDDAGLRIRVDGQEQLLPVSHVVVCAGQAPRRDLPAALQAAGINAQLIGGSDVAAELDAKRAIDQGSRVAAAL